MDNTAYISSIGNSNINCGNITNSHNNINNINNVVNLNKVIADENTEIMQWLSPLDPRKRHQDVRVERLDGVGNWLLETSEFREWRSSEGAEKAVLFCYGSPGVGKTYLSSLVIDHLCDEPGEENIATAGFYCDYRDQHEQTTTNIIGAILKQLVVGEEVLEHVESAFYKAKKELGGRGLRLPDMVQMLKQAIATLPRVFICIDALDECLPKHLPVLLRSLEDILRESPGTRIFVTGRPQVEVEINRRFTTVVIVPISPNTHDIRRYLENKLEMDTEQDAMPDDLRADILRIIPERISEIFLLVSLNIDAILEEVTISERRQKLDAMTGGSHVGDAYATTLARMKAQKGNKPRLGMEALMWVSNSERPLHTSELCHALGVKIGSRDLDPENIPTTRTLLGCSLGLITVEASSSTVRLVHFTLQEYLSHDAGLFQNAHSMIAEVCLTYLNFQSVRELSPTVSSAPPAVPLVEYASRYWGKHITREKIEGVNPLALRLLVGFEQHISSQLLLHWREPGFSQRGGPNGFTGLHGAAFFGIAEIVAALLEMRELDINATDIMGSTALAWAAAEGHQHVVKILLQRRDAKVDTTDVGYGRTPLLWATERGYKGIVKLLLERMDVNPNTAETRYGRTPLWCAVEGEHEGIVELLLKREDIDPNTVDTGDGWTPLLRAVDDENEGIVKLLLEREDINPNTAGTEDGWTPLWCAIDGGKEGIVKLLLEREDINLNGADTEDGGTPLWCAVDRGHEGIVELLLKREDINPNTGDTGIGWAPLLCAADGGNEGIVKLLLGRKDVNPNTAETRYGRTPLLLAAESEHEGIVRLLLERDDLNPNTVDTEDGTTPLLCAAESGYEGIVKLLLERGDINPNIADTEDGRTPLWWAAKGGHVGIVKLLLEEEDIDPNTANTEDGRTPLWLAAERGHEGIVELLLEREDINPNTADTKDGRTPLLLAAESGHEGIVKLLLKRDDITPGAAGTEYGTEGGHEAAVKRLLEQDDINHNTPDTSSGRIPLECAAESGCEGVVKLLLERDDVNPDLPEPNGETTLESAAPRGDVGVVESLTEPRPSLPVQANIDDVPEHPLPVPSDLLQSSSLPTPSVSLLPLESLRPDARPLLGTAIRSLMIVSSLVFIFYFLAIISPSLSVILSLSFSR